MRGVVFTELIEFVENALGFEVADKMIEMAKLHHSGAYTQGGNYPFDEMQKLLQSLCQITKKEPNELLYIFGEHLFTVLVKLYGRDIEQIGSSLNFIDSVENYVHVEVKKLYPDADLPRFETIKKEENSLTLIYQSNKKLEAFAHGLMVACGRFFNEKLDVNYDVISEEPYQVKFEIKKV